MQVHSSLRDLCHRAPLSANKPIMKCLLFSVSLQDFVAQWYLWKHLWWWSPDTTEYLLPPPNPGSDGHLCTGGLQPEPDWNLHQANGAEHRDPRHDPQSSELPGHQYFSSRLQRFRHKSLTGPLGPLSSWECCPVGVRWLDVFSALQRFGQTVLTLATFRISSKKRWAELQTHSNTVRTEVA